MPLLLAAWDRRGVLTCSVLRALDILSPLVQSPLKTNAKSQAQTLIPGLQGLCSLQRLTVTLARDPTATDQAALAALRSPPHRRWRHQDKRNHALSSRTKQSCALSAHLWRSCAPNSAQLCPLISTLPGFGCVGTGAAADHTPELYYQHCFKPRSNRTFSSLSLPACPRGHALPAPAGLG